MSYLRSLWAENRVANAPGPLPRDWILAGAVVLFAIAEIVFRNDITWAVPSLVLMVCIAVLLPWRREHPWPTVFLAFGLSTAAQLTARFLNLEWTGLAAGAFMLIFPYALTRWGSGREAYAGLALVLSTFLVTIVPSGVPLSEIIVGFLFLLFPAVLGASVRFREAAEKRTLEQVKLRERERLARELHDTVAHHVSAIAIQAQAGRAMAVQQQAAALAALETIESEASNTLAEMRRLVRSMRGDNEDDQLAVTSVADIQRLAEANRYPLGVEIKLSGDLAHLDTALLNTLYRLTQESITNAVRHARHAERVDVHIHGGPEEVSLQVHDDGRPVGSERSPGFGLLGMMERAALLGGRLNAGPGGACGWAVEAVLPRSARTL